MKHSVYSIRDDAANFYGKPFFLVNDTVAARVAIDILNDKSTDISKHPSDFSVFRLGEYDDGDASFDLLATPRCVVRFHEIQLNLEV